MSFIIGRKIKMDQLWDKDGKVVPVTYVQAGPVVVTQIKTKDHDGYDAFQVGYDTTVKAKRVSKSVQGHLKDLGKFRFLKEFRKTSDTQAYTKGDTIAVSAFTEGDTLKVTGIEKGRGFQGVVKRHGFHGGPKTHGQKNRLRAPGSLGPTAPQRVMKGKKMAGRMGNETVSIKGIRIIAIDAEKNIFALKGPLPGNNRTILLIQKEQ